MKNVFSTTFMIAILATMTVVTAVEIMPEAEAIKGQGVSNSKYGSATKGIVCGEMLCADKEPVAPTPSYSTERTEPTTSPAAASTETVMANSVMGATVLDAQIDQQSGILTVSINAYDDGNIVIDLPSSLVEVFLIIVDGEEWDSVYVDDNKAEIDFYAGTEKIEIIGNILG
ncbi:MAG: hypothetical protein ACR2LL_05390 [Nitrosopumilus sp.]